MRILIDSDNVTETGYFVPGMGADYMIEIYGEKSVFNNNKTIYRSTLYLFESSRYSHDWNGFIPLTHVELASNGDTTECRVPLFDLGVAPDQPMKLVWQTSDHLGLTDLSEIIFGVNTDDIVIEDILV